MEIAHASQVQVEELVNQEFDLMILGNKQSDRSCFLLMNHKIKAARTLILMDSSASNGNTKLNDKLVSVLGQDIIEIPPTDGSRIAAYLENLINRRKKEEFSILVDYSCMAKNWYAAIINFLYLQELFCEKINVYFAYIPIAFSEPSKESSKQDIHVILKDPVYINTTISQKALVLGLGYDVERAEYIIRKLKPETIYFLYSQPAFDERYTERVLQLNDRLIKNNAALNLIPYPMLNLDKTVELLTTLVLDLRLHHQVVLASFGPKLLTLACLLLFARFPDIEIISAGAETHTPTSAQPINNPVIYKAVFLTDEKCE